MSTEMQSLFDQIHAEIQPKLDVMRLLDAVAHSEIERASSRRNRTRRTYKVSKERIRPRRNDIQEGEVTLKNYIMMKAKEWGLSARPNEQI